ncbi:hypothetical protein SERLA73DRAFT_185341, partial [Serpula lacrymans var. lacrymans S7.3]
MPFVITMLSDGWTTRLERRRGYFDGTYWFKGPDNNEYRWKWRSSWSWRNDLLCVNAHNDMIAAYRVTTMAIAKDGELRIYPVCSVPCSALVYGVPERRLCEIVRGLRRTEVLPSSIYFIVVHT